MPIKKIGYIQQHIHIEDDACKEIKESVTVTIRKTPSRCK